MASYGPKHENHDSPAGRLGDLGYVIVADPPDAFARRLAALSARFGAAIRDAGISAER